MNDTFTAFTCVDWLGDCMCKMTVRWTPWHPPRPRSTSASSARITSYQRLIERAFEKIRQASTGDPAVMIRQLDVWKAMGYVDRRPAPRAPSAGRHDPRAAEASVRENRSDLADVRSGNHALERPVWTPASGASSDGGDRESPVSPILRVAGEVAR